MFNKNDYEIINESPETSTAKAKFLNFIVENRDERIPNTENYRKRFFLTMRQIETFANSVKLPPSRAVISYFSKINAVEKATGCRIFDNTNPLESKLNILEIEFHSYSPVDDLAHKRESLSRIFDNMVR